ncbi:MAG: SLC13 family permease [Pseudomonadota bacterium]
MPEFLIPPDWQPWVALSVLGVMFVLFVRDTYPIAVTALSGAAFLLLMGILPYETALGVLSNPGPWTIAALFMLSSALVRTGTLSGLSTQVNRYAARYPAWTLAGLVLFVVVASAFLNNTPVVVVMIPVMVQMAQTLRISSSKLLIPLSYVAILGGICTLIGTSTNLLVDGVAREAGLAPLSLFEVTPLAVILVAFGILYLWIFAPRLLPDRDSMTQLLSGQSGGMRYFTEVLIPPESTLIGQPPLQVALFRRDNGYVVDVIRADNSLRRQLSKMILAAGDRVVLKTAMVEVLSFSENKDVTLASAVSSRAARTVEALVTPGCRMIGRRLRQLRLRRHYGVFPLALHRKNRNLHQQLDDIPIRVGDTLLLEGTESDLQRLARDQRLIDLSIPAVRPYRRRHAPIVLGALGTMVVLAGLNVAPLFVLASIMVAVVLLTRCIDAEEAFAAIDKDLLILIFSMLAVGAALQQAGAIDILVSALVPWLSGMPPFVVLWSMYLLTSVLTELVSNSTVAVVVTPIAIALGVSLGVDPRPLVVVVMVAASASFATPIGYQTNTLVYGPGGYRFTDFARIGIPLNLVLGLLASALIPLFWPL